jgi:hypothetical protein
MKPFLSRNERREAEINNAMMQQHARGSHQEHVPLEGIATGTR